MVRILHISDPHAQTETMERLHQLAFAQNDCDVVALTGDCVSETCRQLPEAWDLWPQRLRLLVPGNHGDDDATSENLHSWDERKPPWVARLEDLIFLGLAPSLNADPILALIDELGCREWEGINGIVVLCHYRPYFEHNRRLVDVLESLPGSGVLWLHGDEHPSGFCTEWDDSGWLGDKTFFRSNVYSAARVYRGVAHRIEWTGETFRCIKVCGERQWEFT